MLDNPQTAKEIPAAYRTNSIEYAAGVVHGKKLKEQQVVDMLWQMIRTWVRPSALNYLAELKKIIEKIERLDYDEQR